jgi:hypothetical protein
MPKAIHTVMGLMAFEIKGPRRVVMKRTRVCIKRLEILHRGPTTKEGI